MAAGTACETGKEHNHRIANCPYSLTTNDVAKQSKITKLEGTLTRSH